MSKITVIHHSADYDGLFCREIARKFLPDAELIGWDFGNPSLPIPDGKIYVMDLPVDKPFGFEWHDAKEAASNIRDRVTWIDHHKSSIDSHPALLGGYRIDGVAACRLAWQWFTDGGVIGDRALPGKQAFIDRAVHEPLAVRLAGEYDIWDHRDPRAELFQFGLDSVNEPNWGDLLNMSPGFKVQTSEVYSELLCERGAAAKAVIDKRNADIMRERSFLVPFEGLMFLACNFVRCNSKSFASRDKPETGHDALMSFWWDGGQWNVSLYHAEHRKDIDLSLIAVKHGGGGHRGACGFRAVKLPFIP